MGLRASPTNVAGSIAASQLATDLITGIKILPGALTQKMVTGNNGAGACTATGLKVGDKIIGCMNLTDATDGTAAFEGTVTVADQLQQSSASNYSAKKFIVTVLVRS